MSREQDYKIAAWAGYVLRDTDSHGNKRMEYWLNTDGAVTHTNYSFSDADAITLLPLLVKKGFYPALYYSVGNGENAGWRFETGTKTTPTIASTIHEAITEAILKIISECAE